MAGVDPLFARFGKACPAGTVLFREGDAGHTMYVIQAGEVRISRDVADSDTTLAVLSAGDFFGEMAILNDKPRTATATVIEDAKLLIIDSKTFRAMIVGNAEIAVRLIKKLAGRLDAANTLIDILMHTDPKARTILGIVREAEVHGRPQEGGRLVQLDQKTIGSQVGVSEAEAQRVITRLARLGIVREVEAGLLIPDLMRLHEFLEFLRAQAGGR